MIKIITTIICLLSYTTFAEGWVQMANFGGIARHRTPIITLGNKIYTGLGHYNSTGTNTLFNDWWQFDPATGSWSQKADYGGGYNYHSTGFTIGNIGYVGTGRVSSGGNTLVQDFYKYDPATNQWTQIASFPGLPRRGAVSFVIGDYGYVGTGETNPYSEAQDFYRYNPVTNQWTAIASLTGAGRSSAVAFTIGDYGYVGTGNTTSGATNDFWRYNPASNSWSMMANVGPTPRQEAMGFSINGKGYIGTGDNYSSGTNYGDFWEYDPGTNVWTQLNDFTGSARRYLAGTSYNGKGYAGLGTNGTNFKDFWMYDQFLSLFERDKISIDLTPYPNPVIDQLNFDVKGLENYDLSEFQIVIMDPQGKMLRNEKMSEIDEGVDFKEFSTGTYFYSLYYGSTSVKSGTIIKQ